MVRVERCAIDNAVMYAKANDATGVLVHDYQYPVTLQQDGFTSKQVGAPETILGVSEGRQPRWPIVVAILPVMPG